MYQLQIGGHVIMEEGENGYGGQLAVTVILCNCDPSWRSE